MKILFEASWWAEGPIANRTVLREMIGAWAAEFPNDQLVVQVPWRHRRSIADIPPRVRVEWSYLRPQALAAILDSGRACLKHRPDVVLTHNFTPPSGRSVVFIHDLMFETNPEWFTRVERLYFSLMTKSAPYARLVLTSSETEAARIRGVLAPTSTEVVAVGLGIGRDLLEAEPLAVGALDGAQFVLAVGRLNSRKNLENICAAAVRATTVTPEAPLVVVGKLHGKSSSLDASTAAAVERGEIVFLEGVSAAQLRWLYSECRAFVFLSRDEGFGLPPIEAQHFGAPVIASDIPVMREVLEGSARFVSPDDLQAIVAEIDSIDFSRRSAMLGSDRTTPYSEVVRRMREAIEGSGFAG